MNRSKTVFQTQLCFNSLTPKDLSNPSPSRRPEHSSKNALRFGEKWLNRLLCHHQGAVIKSYFLCILHDRRAFHSRLSASFTSASLKWSSSGLQVSPRRCRKSVCARQRCMIAFGGVQNFVDSVIAGEQHISGLIKRPHIWKLETSKFIITEGGDVNLSLLLKQVVYKAQEWLLHENGRIMTEH